MHFDLKTFVKTIFIFIVLSVVWTYFSVRTDRVTDGDKGMLTGLGYLIIFASSVFFGRKQELFYFGREHSFIAYWLVLILLTCIIFSLASYVLLPLVYSLLRGAGDSIGRIVYDIISSIFVAWALTTLLTKFYILESRMRVMIITGICAFLAQNILFLIKKHGDWLPDYWKDIHGLFNIFQFFLIVPLAAGLSFREKEQTAA